MLLLHHLVLAHGQVNFFWEWIGGTCKLCVSIFVFLSGFGLVSKDVKNGTILKTLLVAVYRVSRLYLNFWLVALVSVLLSSFIFGYSVSSVYRSGWFPGFIYELLGAKSVCFYNPTWWFMSVIISLYVLYPALFFLLKKGQLFVLGLLTIGALFVPVRPGLWLAPFIVGMVSARYSLVKKTMMRGHLKVTCYALLVVLLLLRGYCSLRLDVLITFGFIILLLEIRSCIQGCRLGMYLLSILGHHSLNIFLIHTFVYAVYFKLLFMHMNLLGGLIFLATVSVLLSIFIEMLKRCLCWEGLLSFLKRVCLKLNCDLT